MNLNINLVFLLNGLTNIVNHSHYSYLFLGIFQTVICLNSIMLLFFKRGSSQGPLHHISYL